MTLTGPDGTLGQLLAAHRGRRFVGRDAELSLFRELLTTPRHPVLYVHGPGGIGKTSLLDRYAETAVRAGATVVRLDGRDLEPSPPAVLNAVANVLGADDPVNALNAAPRPVLLLDTYERLAPLDDWVRGWLLPRLAAGTVTVLAGRTAPGAGWRTDPAWRELSLVLPLRNLDPAESRRYLTESGVDGAAHDRILGLSHGHPLGLSLLTDVAVRGGDLAVDPLTPDLVGALLQRFVDAVPDEGQRRALEVCALARTTTEALLRDVLDPGTAHELFGWLRGLSFVESGPDGLFPHDLAREALDADLRWRDPETYRRVFRGIRGHLVARLKATTGREQQRALFDAKFMHRHQPVSRTWADWESFGQNYLEPARPDDGPAALELVARWEGADSAAVAEQWWHRRPEGFQVVRHHDGSLRGVLVLVDLTRAALEDVAADPVARTAWDHARRIGAVRPGAAVTQLRFVVDRDAYQRPSPTVNLAPVLSIQHWLATPRLTLHLLTMSEPERWDAYFGFFDIHRVPDGDVEIGGRRYGLFARDFRRVPLDEWLDLMFERDLTGEPAAVPAATAERAAPAELALSRPDFDQAVRQALRDVRRGDRLAGNPLVRTGLVLARSDGRDPAAVLAGLVGEAAERLRSDPRDEKLYRVLDRTFLRPAGTQERAAELLGLPMTTYKRHLRQGVARVTAMLWDAELRAD